jgi:RNA-dependent RNA polymerase
VREPQNSKDPRIVYNPEVILGNVLITRCPCLHPADIRLLKAVSKPELLSHHYNVVIFSSKGKRP